MNNSSVQSLLFQFNLFRPIPGQNIFWNKKLKVLFFHFFLVSQKTLSGFLNLFELPQRSERMKSSINIYLKKSLAWDLGTMLHAHEIYMQHITLLMQKNEHIQFVAW